MRYEGFIVYQNPNVRLVNDACKLCYNGKEEPTLERKLKYIENKVKEGHESVLEHSNIVILMIDNFPQSPDEEEVWAEFAEAAHYLNIKTKKSSDGKLYHLIGGSIRGYKMLIRNINNQDNPAARALLHTMHDLHKEYFFDFIQAGIMSYNKFTDSELIISRENMNDMTPRVKDTYTIENVDKLEFILSEVNNMVGEPLYNADDMMDIVSITVFFTKVSRIISQQFTRHRNGISQESQRYVDSRGIEFIEPLQFKEGFDPNKIYHTEAYGDVTLQELGEKLSVVYGELREQGVHKEDARYLLPQGLRTRFYMTFTMRHFIRFLELRTGSHAQAEIRLIARELLEDIETCDRVKNVLVTEEGSIIFSYLNPKYMDPAAQDIDEIVE